MALTIASQSNTEGVPNLAVISASTDAAAATAQTFTVGFIPRRIVVENLTDNLRYEWMDGMAAGNAIATAANGTRSLSTTAGPTVVAATASSGVGTFTLPAATMVASKSYAIAVEG